MPLFKLLELLETNFHINVSVSDVSKLKNVCKVYDEQGSRMISLLPSALHTALPITLNNVSNFELSVKEGDFNCLHFDLLQFQNSTFYCTVHCPNGMENRGWGESDVVQLPNVRMPLKHFGNRVYQLITAHMGSMPLLRYSIYYCNIKKGRKTIIILL